MRRFTVMISLLLVGLAMTGCSLTQDPAIEDTSAVTDVVIAYTEVLPVAFETFDMNALNQVATEEHAQEKYIFMAALGEGRVQMLSELRDIEFGEVTFPEEGVASVTTTETWDYDHVSLDTSETVRTERGVVYRLRYDLAIQPDGRWFVTAVTSVDEPPVGEDATPVPSETATP